MSRSKAGRAVVSDSLLDFPCCTLHKYDGILSICMDEGKSLDWNPINQAKHPFPTGIQWLHSVPSTKHTAVTHNGYAKSAKNVKGSRSMGTSHLQVPIPVTHHPALEIHCWFFINTGSESWNSKTIAVVQGE